MTVNDFIARLNKLGITGDEPLIVSCFGGLTCNRNVIEHVHKGFDWHMGCVVLQPTLRWLCGGTRDAIQRQGSRSHWWICHGRCHP